MKLKILYLTNIPSPYMVDFLNEFGKKCELTVIFERGQSGVRDESWKQYEFKNFHGIILKGCNIKTSDESDDQAICPQVIRYIKKNKYHYTIVANPCTPTGILAILFMKICKITYGIQSEGGFPKNGIGIKEKFKKLVVGNADLYFSTADVGDAYFVKYGADKQKIKRYPFTSLHYHEILHKPTSIENKELFKKKLNIPYQQVILSVGRFIPVKGFDIIIKACQDLKADVGVYIVGGNPTGEYLELKEKAGLTNLHFVGHVNKEQMIWFYYASDIFVLNSRGDTWGLVINEAMSFGLPVISSDKCYAALALIENDENGFIVPVDNTEEFHKHIEFLLHSPYVCKRISENNIKKMQKCTLEEMANVEMEILEAVLNE